MTLKSIVNGDLPFPTQKSAICLWGTYGTGKTTLAEMLPMLLEASADLIPSTRAVRIFASQDYWHLTRCGFGSHAVTIMQDLHKRGQSDTRLSPKGYFYEILDEVDILTPAAQASLKSTISHADSTIFIMTTNHPNKLDRGLVDRSYMIEMNQPKYEEMDEMGRRFLRQMGLTGKEVDDATMQGLAKSSQGSLRDFGSAVFMLGQIAKRTADMQR